MTESPAADILVDTVLDATGAEARIARVYAEALTRTAADPAAADALADELETVAASVRGKAEVETFFASAAVSKANKFPVLAAAFENNTSPTFRKFVAILNQNGRLGLLPAVASEYRKLRDTATKRVRVTVTAAVELTPEQQESLQKTLAAKLSGTPVVTVRVDPDILGGLVVKVGDTVTDSSVRTRLNNLRTHLMASGTNG